MLSREELEEVIKKEIYASRDLEEGQRKGSDHHY